MKILWIKAGGVVPCDTGGKIRSFQILRELARRHAVTLFTFYPEHPNDQHPQLTGFAEVIATPLAIPRTRTLGDYLNYARHWFSGASYSMEKYYTPALRQKARDVLAGGFDVVICDFVHPAGLIDWTRPVPKVLFTHNVEAQIWQRHADVTSHPVWKAIYHREAGALAHAEKKYVELADHVLTVSENDRDFFRRYVPADRITAIPTGVDVEFYRPSTDADDPNAIVFTGSMDWMPNEDGIAYFADEMLPAIRREQPDAHLWVVGRRPTRRVQSLANEYITVTGDVDDIRPYVHRARAYITPLRSGSGTRIKIFEAMAMGKAVVSTTVGAEGLPVTHDANILIADDPGDFARCVVRLLREPDLAHRIGTAARELVETRYSWPAVVDYFDIILRRIGHR